MKRFDFHLQGVQHTPWEGQPSSGLMRGHKSIKINVHFIVVDSHLTYNAILSRTTINHHKILTTTVYQKMKFPNPHEVGEVWGDQITSRK